MLVGVWPTEGTWNSGFACDCMFFTSETGRITGENWSQFQVAGNLWGPYCVKCCVHLQQDTDSKNIWTWPQDTTEKVTLFNNRGTITDNRIEVPCLSTCHSGDKCSISHSGILSAHKPSWKGYSFYEEFGEETVLLSLRDLEKEDFLLLKK